MTMPRAAKGALKIVLLIVLIAALRLYVFEHWVDLEQMQSWIVRQGILAPLLFTAILILTMVLYLPSALFVGLGAISFGLIRGPLLSLAGLTLGASIAFLIGRRLGREAAGELLTNRLAALRRVPLSRAARGVPFVWGLRLTSFFDTATNYALGATPVGFWRQLAGTALGFIPPIYLVSLSFQTIWQARSLREMTLYNPYIWCLPALRAFGVLVLVLAVRASRKPKEEVTPEPTTCCEKTAAADSETPGILPCRTR